MQLFIILGLKKSDGLNLSFNPTVLDAFNDETAVGVIEKQLKLFKSNIAYSNVSLVKMNIRDKDLAKVMLEQPDLFGEGLERLDIKQGKICASIQD